MERSMTLTRSGERKGRRGNAARRRLTAAALLFMLCIVADRKPEGVRLPRASAQAQRTVWDGIYTNEQADRGQKVYVERCAQCHGDGLAGIESAPPLTGAEFASNWEGTPLGDLFERMRMSMPQDKPGSLSRAQNADILAYMLRVGGFPAGERELDGQAGALASVTFRMYKPQ
jgi:mono/diheme cytochrome c family protein